MMSDDEVSRVSRPTLVYGKHPAPGEALTGFALCFYEHACELILGATSTG